MATTALFPGTFDPITLGHMALIREAAHQFDHVIVCILVNPDKTPLFQEETRLAMLRAATASFPNVSVTVDHGMTADLAARLGAVIVRGYRNDIDYAYEQTMADFNKARAGVETQLFPAPREYVEVSATRVREALLTGQSVKTLVPDEILPFLSFR